MAQRMNGHIFGDIRSFHRSVEGILDTGGSDRNDLIAEEKPTFRMLWTIRFQIFTQYMEASFRKQGKLILAAFAAFNKHPHVFGIDMLDFKSRGFTDTQTRAVDQCLMFSQPIIMVDISSLVSTSVKALRLFWRGIVRFNVTAKRNRIAALYVFTVPGKDFFS